MSLIFKQITLCSPTGKSVSPAFCQKVVQKRKSFYHIIWPRFKTWKIDVFYNLINHLYIQIKIWMV